MPAVLSVPRPVTVRFIIKGTIVVHKALRDPDWFEVPEFDKEYEVPELDEEEGRMREDKMVKEVVAGILDSWRDSYGNDELFSCMFCGARNSEMIPQVKFMQTDARSNTFTFVALFFPRCNTHAHVADILLDLLASGSRAQRIDVMTNWLPARQRACCAAHGAEAAAEAAAKPRNMCYMVLP